jgi:hypothetical protein
MPMPHARAFNRNSAFRNVSSSSCRVISPHRVGHHQYVLLAAQIWSKKSRLAASVARVRIRNTDIITASGTTITPPGTGFIDHPLGFVGKVRFKKEVSGAIDRLSLTVKGDYVVRSALRLKSECGRYTCCAFLRPALTMGNILAIYKHKSLLGATTGLTRIRNAFSWKLFHPDIMAEVVSHLFGVNVPGRTFNVLFVGEQRRGASRVYYQDDALRVNWSIAEELAICIGHPRAFLCQHGSYSRTTGVAAGG